MRARNGKATVGLDYFCCGAEGAAKRLADGILDDEAALVHELQVVRTLISACYATDDHVLRALTATLRETTDKIAAHMAQRDGLVAARQVATALLRVTLSWASKHLFTSKHLGRWTET